MLATDNATRRRWGGHDQPKACATAAPAPSPPLRNRARHRDTTYGKQLVEVELQPQAEHQEDDADFGQLFRQSDVGDKAWRVRADEHAGQQVSYER